jgi:hypothetical protein
MTQKYHFKSTNKKLSYRKPESFKPRDYEYQLRYKNGSAAISFFDSATKLSLGSPTEARVISITKNLLIRAEEAFTPLWYQADGRTAVSYISTVTTKYNTHPIVKFIGDTYLAAISEVVGSWNNTIQTLVYFIDSITSSFPEQCNTEAAHRLIHLDNTPVCLVGAIACALNPSLKYLTYSTSGRVSGNVDYEEFPHTSNYTAYSVNIETSPWLASCYAYSSDVTENPENPIYAPKPLIEMLLDEENDQILTAMAGIGGDELNNG